MLKDQQFLLYIIFLFIYLYHTHAHTVCKHKIVLRSNIHHHLLQTLTDVVAFDGAEHAEGLNQPAAVLQQAVQVGTRTELITRNTGMA